MSKMCYYYYYYILLLLLEKTNFSCRKQASRTGYKVNKAIQEHKQGNAVNYRLGLYDWLNS